MGLLTVLRDLAVKLERQNNSLFTYPIDKQKAYIAKLGEAKNDIERSYYQYKCQSKFNKPIVNLILNIASLPVIFLYLCKKDKKPDFEKEYDGVFFADGKPENIVPQALKNRLPRWLTIDNKKEYLSKSDKMYFCYIARRYPFSWQFLLKCLLKIRFYSYEIEAHNPKAFVVCNEYSFTSSLLTDYCNKRKRQHINVMHGEKLYYMRDSFFRFDECYVWNQIYVDLFIELKAEPSQFAVEVPDSILFTKRGTIKKEYDYTYYLGAEEKEVLTKLLNSINKLAAKGYKVAIRPHPRYSNIDEINKNAHGIIVEDTSVISIEESVLRSKNAISGYSTVLNQAIHNGTGVVIDDLTQPEAFAKLQELGYVMLKMKHKLLSDIVD